MASNLYVTLNNGRKMPKMGFGTASLKINNTFDDKIRNAVDEALKCGYRAIDTAFLYQNEEVIGQVLAEWFSKGKLLREDVFITSKLPPFGNRPEDVSRFLNLSLQRLKLDYLDLFLVHHPFGFKCSYDSNTFATHSNGDKVVDFDTNIEDVWREMEKQVEAGKVKAIGLSNFNVAQMERIKKIAKIAPVANQIEVHCYLQQRPLVQKCKELEMKIIGYAPLGASFTQEGQSITPILLENPVVLEIAKNHQKTSAQILLKFLLQQDIIVIPKSVTPERIKENFDVFDFELSSQEMESLLNLEKGEPGRVYHFKTIFSGVEKHKEYPF